MARGKRDEHLLIDGYNIIFAWEELKKISGYSMEDARRRLLHILSDYKGFSGHEIIVVFDAHKVKDNLGSIEKYGNITAVFTKEFETADNYIERYVNSIPKNISVRVATDDGLEQIVVISKGAQRISSTDLYNEVKTSKKFQNEKYIKNRPIKNNLLFDNLDPALRNQLEKMRRQKGDETSDSL